MLVSNLHRLSGTVEQDKTLCIEYDNKTYEVKYYIKKDSLIQAVINSESYISTIYHHENDYFLSFANKHYQIKNETGSHSNDHTENQGLQAPMPGTLISIKIKIGDMVKAGDTLAIVEAMKMEHTIKAPVTGKVKNLAFNEGDFINEGENLLEID